MLGHTSLKTVMVGVLAMAVAMGCEVESDDVMGPATQPPPAPVHQPVSVVNQHGPIELTLTADRAAYERYETVRLEIRVRNTSHGSVTFNFITGKQHDFTAEAHGGPVWRYSDGRQYSLVANHVTLQPGETWTREGAWDQRDSSGWEVPRGVYGVRGIITHYSQGGSGVYTELLPIALR